jgi:hypothetical protein
MDNANWFGFGISATSVAMCVTFVYSINRYDTLVDNIPSVENYKLCESLSSELHSFDKSTATCKNGFEFDLIKVAE